MKRIVFSGAAGLPSAFDPTLGYGQNFLMVGGNTGNMLIGHAVRQLIAGNKEVPRISLWGDLKKVAETAAQINHNFDHMIIGAANFINPWSNWGYAISLLDKLKIPVTTLGLGAQSTWDFSFNILKRLPKDTIRFVRLLSDQSNSLSVRGEFTAELLTKLGIKNVTVTGCPSFFINGDSFRVEKKNIDDHLKLAFHSHLTLSKVNSVFLPAFLQRGATYIAQNEPLLLKMIFFPAEITRKDIVQAERAGFKARMFCNPKLYKQLRVFYDLETWSDFIKTFDFVCGGRIHGTIIALQNGVPAFCLVHDSRTREMCELFSIPHLNVHKTKFVAAPEAWYEQADYGPMNKNYQNLLENFTNFLRANNLPTENVALARHQEMGNFSPPHLPNLSAPQRPKSLYFETQLRILHDMIPLIEDKKKLSSFFGVLRQYLNSRYPGVAQFLRSLFNS